MTALINTLFFFFNVIVLFAGLFSCICAGYLLEREKGPTPLHPYDTGLVHFVLFGGTMVGAAGGKLELWTQQFVFKEQAHVPFFGAILLVIGGFACVGLGMWVAYKENHPSDTE